MKQNILFRIFHWFLNITLVIVALGSVGLVVLGFITSGNPLPDTEKLKGVTSLNFKTTHNNKHFFYEYRTKEDGNYEEHFYFVNPRKLYSFEASDSLMASFKIRDEEQSSDKSILGGFMQFQKSIYKESVELPLRLGHPGYPISREQFVSSFRFLFWSYLFHGAFIFVFFWFLRKFVLGLRENNFFTDKNFSYLRNTAYVLMVYPFAVAIWNHLGKIDPQVTYGGDIFSISTPEFGFSFLVFGIILLIVAVVFQQGVELQKEQELTI